MSKELNGYKVVNWQRRSSHADNGGEVRYYKSRWTKPNPNCGPLCVFAKLEDACAFRWQCFSPDDGALIYLCKYKPSRACSVWQGDAKTPIWELQEGKRLATAVRLVRKEA
jgi:hypothetical protein